MIFYLPESYEVGPLSTPVWHVIHQRKNPAYFEMLHWTSDLEYILWKNLRNRKWAR
jgi:hypothetical protein